MAGTSDCLPPKKRFLARQARQEFLARQAREENRFLDDLLYYEAGQACRLTYVVARYSVSDHAAFWKDIASVEGHFKIHNLAVARYGDYMYLFIHSPKRPYLLKGDATLDKACHFNNGCKLVKGSRYGKERSRYGVPLVTDVLKALSSASVDSMVFSSKCKTWNTEYMHRLRAKKMDKKPV